MCPFSYDSLIFQIGYNLFLRRILYTNWRDIFTHVNAHENILLGIFKLDFMTWITLKTFHVPFTEKARSR
jgi:hypothetical protein